MTRIEIKRNLILLLFPLSAFGLWWFIGEDEFLGMNNQDTHLAVSDLQLLIALFILFIFFTIISFGLLKLAQLNKSLKILSKFLGYVFLSIFILLLIQPWIALFDNTAFFSIKIATTFSVLNLGLIVVFSLRIRDFKINKTGANKK